jgi:hypothetical protein
MVSIKHATLSAARPEAGIGAAMWDDDHAVPLATQAEARDSILLTALRRAEALAVQGGRRGFSAV